MKKRIIVLMFVVLAVSLATGFAATVAVPAKKAAGVAKPPAVNPLLGTWTFGKSNSINFSDHTVTIIAADPIANEDYRFDATFTYSASPLKIQYEDNSGQTCTLLMSYKVVGNKLTYRFLNTGSRDYTEVRWVIYQKLVNAKIKKTADADFVAVKKYENMTSKNNVNK